MGRHRKNREAGMRSIQIRWREFWEERKIRHRKRVLRRWALGGMQIVVSPCFRLMSPEYFMLHSRKEVREEAVRIFERLEEERNRIQRELWMQGDLCQEESLSDSQEIDKKML